MHHQLQSITWISRVSDSESRIQHEKCIRCTTTRSATLVWPQPYVSLRFNEIVGYQCLIGSKIQIPRNLLIWIGWWWNNFADQFKVIIMLFNQIFIKCQVSSVVRTLLSLRETLPTTSAYCFRFISFSCLMTFTFFSITVRIYLSELVSLHFVFSTSSVNSLFPIRIPGYIWSQLKPFLSSVMIYSGWQGNQGAQFNTLNRKADSWGNSHDLWAYLQFGVPGSTPCWCLW